MCMLDIKTIRENPEAVLKNLERRRNPNYTNLLRELLKEDREWRQLLLATEGLRKRRNEIAREITEAKKSGNPHAKLLAEAKGMPSKIKNNGKRQDVLKRGIHEKLMRLPNLLHNSVPYGKSEAENVTVHERGTKQKFPFPLRHHGELALSIGGADFERAVKISGAGFFFLQRELALLDLALQRFAVDMLTKKGFVLTLPPHLMRRTPYEGVTDLKDFSDVMYKIQDEDLYLIATSEHPLAAMYMDEILRESDLPIKLVGLSHCFRREIGKHGVDECGFFRVHQFTKVEQFVFCRPEESEEMHEQLARNSEELLDELELPYRRVNVCTGDIGIVAAKKYDIEAWSPREEKYIELMSCSNCTDYQANRLGIRYIKPDGARISVHTLNNTMVATARALRAILENHQTKQGTLKVPRVLQPYMNGIKEIKPLHPQSKKQ